MYRARLRRRLVIMGVFAGAVLISLVVPAILPHDGATWIVIGTIVAALIAVSQLVWPKELWDDATLRFKACAAAAATVATVVQVLLLVAVPDWSLRMRGESMSVTVGAERVEETPFSREPDTHAYTLVTAEGRVLESELKQQGDYFDPGDRVRVVVDRWDLIDPQVASYGEADDKVLMVAAGALFGLMLVLCFVAGGMSPDGAGGRKGMHARTPARR